MFKLVRLSNVVSRRALNGKQLFNARFERSIRFAKSVPFVRPSPILFATSIFNSPARFFSTSVTPSYTELEQQADEIWKSAKNLDQAIQLQHDAYNACSDPSIKIDLFLKYVDMLVHTGNVDKALVVTEDAITQFPSHAHEFHMRRGLIFESMNNLRAAREEYQTLLESDPSHFTALRSLAYTYCQEAEAMSPDQRVIFAENAVELFTKARELTPVEQDKALIDTLYGRATAYRMLKKYAKAGEDLAYIIELDRDYAPAYLVLGDLMQIEGKYSDALFMYEKFFDAFTVYYKDATTKDVAVSSGHLLGYMQMQRGICYMHCKDYGMATESFKNIISIPGYEDHDVAHLMLGKSLIQEGKWEQSVTALSRALELNAGLLDGYHERAEAYEHLGKFDEAKKDRDMLAMLQRERLADNKTVK